MEFYTEGVIDLIDRERIGGYGHDLFDALCLRLHERFIERCFIHPDEGSETLPSYIMARLVKGEEFHDGVILVMDPYARHSLGPVDIVGPEGDSPLSPYAGEEVGERFRPVVVLNDEAVLLIDGVSYLLFIHRKIPPLSQR